MDALENFIKENREAFDSEHPSADLWQRIEASLPEERVVVLRPRSRFRALRIAAAVLLLIGTGTVLGLFLNPSHFGPASGATTFSLAAVAPQHAEAEQFFRRQIAGKVAQLQDAGKAEEVMTDLNQLEKQMEELKKAFQEAPRESREFIIHSMIQNYQLRIELLERVLEEVRSSHPQNNKDYETEGIAI